MFPEDTAKSQVLLQILAKHGFNNTEISLAIIDLTQKKPTVFGYQMNHFIYAASMYKVFIAAEVLRRVEYGDLKLSQAIEVFSPNDVDQDPALFPGDKRPLLKASQKITIELLLDLMLTRSDNTAANQLIDLVDRQNINKHIIGKYGWYGSEITRKFLPRGKEDEAYQSAKPTASCARHLAEFFYLVETGSLISPYVSSQLKTYMRRFNRQSKKGLWLPGVYANYYCKGGWFETTLYEKSKLSSDKSVHDQGNVHITWSNDSGVVTGTKSKYVISLFSVNKSMLASRYFPTQKLAGVVSDFMKQAKAVGS